MGMSQLPFQGKIFNDSMRIREVALSHNFFKVAVTEGVAQIPAHAEKDDLGFIVSPLEEIGFGHRQTSEEDSGSRQSTILDTRYPFFATQPLRVLYAP